MIALLYDSDYHENKLLKEILSQQETLTSLVCTTYENWLHSWNENTIRLLFLSADISHEYLKRVLDKMREKDVRPLLCLVGTKNAVTRYAFRFRCDRFLIQPYTQEEVLHCLQELYTLGSKKPEVCVKAFGTFNVTVNGNPVMFHNAKAKELFALCIDKAGGAVHSTEAIGKLWPNRPYDERTERLYRKAVSAIVKTLKSYGVADVFYHFRGGCGVYSRSINCDYFSFIEHPHEYSRQLIEHYMPSYDWAEGTIGRLTMLLHKTPKKRPLSTLLK